MFAGSRVQGSGCRVQGAGFGGCLGLRERDVVDVEPEGGECLQPPELEGERGQRGVVAHVQICISGWGLRVPLLVTHRNIAQGLGGA